MGLRGDNIPLGSRILAVADAFEAMTADRPYREALGFERAITELKNNAGSQFDPRIIEAFIDLIKSDKSSKRIEKIKKTIEG